MLAATSCSSRSSSSPTTCVSRELSANAPTRTPSTISGSATSDRNPACSSSFLTRDRRLRPREIGATAISPLRSARPVRLVSGSVPSPMTTGGGARSDPSPSQYDGVALRPSAATRKITARS